MATNEEKARLAIESVLRANGVGPIARSEFTDQIIHRLTEDGLITPDEAVENLRCGIAWEHTPHNYYERGYNYHCEAKL